MSYLSGYDPTPYDDYFVKYGTQYGLDPGLLRTQVGIESAFNPRAVSPAGARGLAQFMPATGAQYGLVNEEDFFNPEKSIAAQAKYMRELMDRYDGNAELALTAYNAGMGNVERKNAYDWSEPTQYRERFFARYKPPQEKDPSLIRSGGGQADLSHDAYLSELLAQDQRRGQDHASYIESLLGSQSKSYTTEDHDSYLASLTSNQGEAAPTSGPIANISEEAQRRGLRLGSKEYAKFVNAYGGQSSLTPSRVLTGEPYAGEKRGHQYMDQPIHYKGRIVRHIDADTMEVEEMGTGELRTVRYEDINAAELGTPEGEEAAKTQAGRFPVGSQVTLTTAPGDEYGAHGRDTAKVYAQGRYGAIDLSAPDQLTGEQVGIGGEESPGVLDHAGQLLLSAAREVPELVMAPEDLWDWIGGLTDGRFGGDPATKSGIHQAMQKLEERWHEAERQYVSGPYDPDATTYDIPLLGKHTIGEVVRATASTTAYGLGVTFGLGKLFKATRAAAETSKMLRTLDSVDDAGELANYLPELKKVFLRQTGDAAKAEKLAQSVVERASNINRRTKDTVRSLTDVNPRKSAVQRIATWGRLWQANFFDKAAGLRKLSKRAGKPTMRYMEALIDQIRAGEEFASSPITEGVIRYTRNKDGTLVPRQVTEPLTKIWQGDSAEAMRHGMVLWAYRNATKVEIPRFQRYMRLAGNNLEKARELAAKAGEKFVDFDPSEIPEINRVVRDIEGIYRDLGQLDLLNAKVERTQNWFSEVGFEQIRDVGGVGAQDYNRIKRYMQGFYAPWHRFDVDEAAEVFDPQLASELGHALDGLDDMIVAKGKQKVRPQTPGDKKPLAGRKHGLGEGARAIVDPMDTILAKSVAINKWANRQRVRNLLGEVIEEVGPDNIRGLRVERGRQMVQKIARATPDDTIISFAKQADGSVAQTAYRFDDPEMQVALGMINPSQAQMLSGIIRNMNKATGIFRKGTILGLNFLIRNPIRDQFMAATLSKYGYFPVVDWWRGVYHTLRKSPVYRAFRAHGGSQSSHTGVEFNRAGNFAIDKDTGELVSDYFKILDDPELATVAHHAGSPGLVAPKGGPADHILGRIRNSTGSFLSSASKEEGFFARFLSPLVRVSEIFEEGTRVGAGARAVARAKKGKRYSFLRSLDEAAGGTDGWAKLLFSRKARKDFFTRFNKAHRYSDEEMAMMAPKLDKHGRSVGGDWWNSEMTDEVRNISLDFARNGVYGETLNALYPFFNAELQDYWRFTKAMRDAPLTTITKAFSYITVPAIANWYLNYDNPKYHQLSDVEKDLFYHPFGYDEKYRKFGRVPRPLGTVNGVFGLTFHKALDFMAAQDPAFIRTLEETMWPGRAARQAKKLYQESLYETNEMPPEAAALLGIASMGMGGFGRAGAPVAEEERVPGDPLLQDTHFAQYLRDQITDYASTNTVARYFIPTKENTLTSTMAPQAFAPLAHINQNWDPFFKAPIVPPRFMNEELLPEDIYTESTSPMERGLSAAFNAITPDAMAINPIQMGYLIRRYTGSLGASLMTLGDWAGQSSGVFPERPSHINDMTDRPGLGGLYSREPFGSNSAPVRELYDQWEKDKKILGSVGYNVKAMRPERIIDLYQKHPEMLPAKLLEQASKRLSQMHKVRRRIRGNSELTREERADHLFQLDQYMTMYAYQVMEAYNSLRNDPALMATVAGLMGDE